MRVQFRTLIKLVQKHFECTIDGNLIRFGEPSDEDYSGVRISLVDGNLYSSEQGIHIRFSNKEELESSLVDAIQTAIKDGFVWIYVHQKPKPNEEARQRKIKCAIDWLTAMKKHGPSTYHLNKLFFDAEVVLQGMTEDQVSLLVAMVCGQSIKASDESRQYWATAYHAFKDRLRNECGQDVVNEVHSQTSAKRGA